MMIIFILLYTFNMHLSAFIEVPMPDPGELFLIDASCVCVKAHNRSELSGESIRRSVN